VLKDKVLEVALTSRITDGAIERMVNEQQLEVVLPHLEEPV
jgi:hypothetical protein